MLSLLVPTQKRIKTAQLACTILEKSRAMGVFSTPGDLTWFEHRWHFNNAGDLTLGHLQVAKYAERITMNRDES